MSLIRGSVGHFSCCSNQTSTSSLWCLEEAEPSGVFTRQKKIEVIPIVSSLISSWKALHCQQPKKNGWRQTVAGARPDWCIGLNRMKSLREEGLNSILLPSRMLFGLKIFVFNNLPWPFELRTVHFIYGDILLCLIRHCLSEGFFLEVTTACQLPSPSSWCMRQICKIWPHSPIRIKVHNRIHKDI